MSLTSSILVFLSLFIISQGQQKCKEVFYDFYVLALTWPTQYCQEQTCKTNWKQLWNGKSFTIHGFWPSSTDLSYLTCSKDTLHDPFCHHPYNFSQNLFTKAELSQINQYWPQIGTMNNFWGYEWKKHGTCYLQIIKDQYKSKMTQTQIFKNYFLGTVAKVKELNLTLKPGKFDSKINFAKALGLHASQFYAICGSDNQLDEIRICYDMDQNPGYEPVRDCPTSTDRKQCKFPMYIK